VFWNSTKLKHYLAQGCNKTVGFEPQWLTFPVAAGSGVCRVQVTVQLRELGDAPPPLNFFEQFKRWPPPLFGRWFFGRRLLVIWALGHDTLFVSPNICLVSFFSVLTPPPYFKNPRNATGRSPRFYPQTRNSSSRCSTPLKLNRPTLTNYEVHMYVCACMHTCTGGNK